MSSVIGAEEVAGRLAAYVEKLQQEARGAADTIGTLLETYARSHHDWKTRTGATDAGTSARVEDEEENQIRIVLMAVTPYALFLERTRGGRWAWLGPTLAENQERIAQILQERLRAVGERWEP